MGREVYRKPRIPSMWVFNASRDKRWSGAGDDFRLRVRCCDTDKAASEAIAGAPRIFDCYERLSILQLKADLHGLDRIVSFFDAIDFDELCRVREQQLVHDLELVFARLYGD